MAYTTIELIRTEMTNEELVQVTDDNNTGEVDTTIVTQMINNAHNEVLGILRGRYPDDYDADEIPLQVKNIETKIAVYNLFKRRLRNNMPDPAVSEYKQAVKDLKEIQKGSISPFEAEDEPEAIKTNKTSSDKVYDSDKWDGYFS